jgi:hypothetical protein
MFQLIGKHHIVVGLSYQIKFPFGFTAQFIVFCSICQHVNDCGAVPPTPKGCVVVRPLVEVLLPKLKGPYPTHLSNVALQIERQVLVISVVAGYFVLGLQLRLDHESQVFDGAALINERQAAVQHDKKESSGQS